MSGSLVGRYLHARERAVAAGDAGLVAECDWNLARLGYNPDRPETAVVAEEKAEAEVRPRRGRPPTRREG